MKLRIQSCYIEDLVLHCLTHLKAENDSELYDPAYIASIAKAKEEQQFPNTLEESMQSLQTIYQNGGERLLLINFIPFYVGTREEFETLLLKQPFFTKEDKEQFLQPFLAILKEEEVFYRPYWEKQMEHKIEVHERFLQKAREFLGKFPSLTERITLPIDISLQLSMTRAGRATQIGESELIAVRYPCVEAEDMNSLLQVMHELTHMVTDELLGCEISLENETHMQAEYVVFAADYLLLEKYAPELLHAYTHFLGISAFEFADLLNLYPVEAKLLAQLKEMF